jgi:N utilization substance protein A
MIPNALQPAQIEEVFLYPRLGRAIVLVKEDQLSLAIGRRGQNVRLASKLVGWDIEIMTHEELTDGVERAEGWFSQLPGVTPELVETFIEEGFLSYDDLTFLEAAQLAELAGVTEEQAEEMIIFAEEMAEKVEEETKAARAAEAAEGPRPAPARSGAPTAADLFPEASEGPPPEARPTVESLFGPEPTAIAEEEPTPSAEELFAENPPPPPVNGEEGAEEKPSE